jgi:tetratricopeptide (TPR) repeat protein
MKSEHRHELQTNVLADRLGTGIEKVQPYSQVLVGGLIALAIAAIGFGIYSSVTRKNASQAWTEYYFTLNSEADAFTDVADKFPGSSAATWAQQTAGDGYLADGIDALYRNRAQADELIKKAIESYSAVVKTASQPELRTRAQLGLAQAHESLGELDKAKDYYQQVVSAAIQPALTSVASNRLAFLNTPEGKEFYAWFSTFKPVPAKPLELPGNLNTVPSTPDLQFGPAGTSQSPLDTSNLALPPAATTEAAPTESSPLSIELPNQEVPATTPDSATPTASTPEPTSTPAAEAAPGTDTAAPTSEPAPVDPK